MKQLCFPHTVMIEWGSDKEGKLVGIKDFLDSIFIIFTNVILYIF